MKLNKENFLKTELGEELIKTIDAIDKNLYDQIIAVKTGEKEEYRRLKEEIKILLGKWEVFALMIKQFFGAEYHISRMNEYYGCCDNEEKDWLIKKER